MTHEENFQRIENALAHLAEVQANAEERHRKSMQESDDRAARIERSLARISRHVEVLAELVIDIIRDRRVRDIEERVSALESRHA